MPSNTAQSFNQLTANWEQIGKDNAARHSSSHHGKQDPATTRRTHSSHSNNAAASVADDSGGTGNCSQDRRLGALAAWSYAAKSARTDTTHTTHDHSAHTSHPQNLQPYNRGLHAENAQADVFPCEFWSTNGTAMSPAGSATLNESSPSAGLEQHTSAGVRRANHRTMGAAAPLTACELADQCALRAELGAAVKNGTHEAATLSMATTFHYIALRVKLEEETNGCQIAISNSELYAMACDRGVARAGWAEFVRLMLFCTCVTAPRSPTPSAPLLPNTTPRLYPCLDMELAPPPYTVC